MSRDANGTYTLPPGNPVSPGTTITSTWANTTLSNIASALTDSLSRSGLGGMQAALALADGTSALPGLSWGTETNSGLFRNAANDFRWVVTTTELLQLTTNLFRVSGTAPSIRLNESDASANNHLWDINVNAEILAFRSLTDALVATNWMTVSRTASAANLVTFSVFTAFTGLNSTIDNAGMMLSNTRPLFVLQETDGAANNKNWGFGASAEQLFMSVINDAGGGVVNWLQVDRTGTTVDTVNFNNGTLQYGGIEVGYRGYRQRRDFSSTDNTAATDAGGILLYTGAGGITFTCDSDPAAQSIITLINAGSGSFTVAASTTMAWYTGAAITSGSRTLAVGGVVTLWHSGGGNWNIWGAGIT